MNAATKPKKPRSHAAMPKVYVLHIELEGLEPSIWRRLHVDGRIRLDALHHILQAVMGWSASHLHNFRIRTRFYGPPEDIDSGLVVLDEKDYALSQLLTKGDAFDYIYDFGDDWLHTITVEDVRAVTEQGNEGFAWVEAGDRACPPDDAGGPIGYQSFLNDFENHPYGEETIALQEWWGIDFDPERFDRAAVNAAINRMFSNRWIEIVPPQG